MGKNKKKRNKVYAGADAAMVRPNITRIEAVNRSKIGQYWYDHKKTFKPLIRVALIVIFVIIIVVEIIRIATGNGF